MAYTLTIDPGGANELVLSAGEITEIDFARTHTALGDFRADLAGIRSELETRLFDEVHLEDGGTFLFRGYLEIVDLREAPGDASTHIGGRGIGRDLSDGATSRTFTNALGYDAIQTYWDSETSFLATVTAPTATEVVTNKTVQSASTNAEFSSITSIAADEPFEARNGNIELLQTAYVAEGEDRDRDSGALRFTDAAYSGGDGWGVTSNGQWIEWDFTTEYTIPQARVGVAIRDDASDFCSVSIQLDGNEIDSLTSLSGTNSLTLTWADVGDGHYNGSGWTFGDLAAGTHTLRVECTGTTDAGEQYVADVVCLYDKNYSPTFDNSVDANGYLSGPELYPTATITFDSNQTQWNIADGELTTTWNDTSNDQAIQMRLGSQTWFPNDGTQNNTATVSTGFGSEVGGSIQARATLSAYGTRTTATPTQGFNGQKLQSWDLKYTANDLAVFDSVTVEGDHLQNLIRLHELAGMRFVIEHAAGSKTAQSFQQGDVQRSEPDWRIKRQSKKMDLTGYANDVTVRGANSGGTRLTQTATNSAGVTKYGTRHVENFDVTLDTQNDVNSSARKELGARLREGNRKGQLTIVPLGLDPGVDYTVTWFDGTTDTIPLEEINYRVSAGDVEATLMFEFPTLGLAENLGGLRGGLDTTQRGI